MKGRDILVTGFPSFVARRLLGVILDREKDAFVRLLVRPDYVDEAERQLQAMDVDRTKIELMAGDVVAMDLGLSGMEYLEVIENVTDIYHVASIWWLGVDQETSELVNVAGTRNVLDAALEMKNLSRLNHFSTAFVAGDRTGVIMEDELNEGQRFRNAYEETKFRAERALQDASRSIPISIFRPAIIVGDSQTGEIDKMAGPYYIMNAIVLMPPNVPVLMPGKGDKPLNLVPIDWVCKAMHRISLRADASGKTFHLCDPNPLSARKVFELVADVAGRRAPIGRFPYRLTKMLLKFPYLEKLTRSPRQFMDDFNQLTIYNCFNTFDALGADEACPPFPSYVAHLVNYIKATDSTLDVDVPNAAELLG